MKQFFKKIIIILGIVQLFYFVCMCVCVKFVNVLKTFNIPILIYHYFYVFGASKNFFKQKYSRPLSISEIIFHLFLRSPREPKVRRRKETEKLGKKEKSIFPHDPFAVPSNLSSQRLKCSFPFCYLLPDCVLMNISQLKYAEDMCGFH